MESQEPVELTPIQIRVLGCLLEKQITTPDQYPLSRNALRNACNQKSNRDPVVSYEEGEIGHALRQLEKLKLVSEEWSVRVPKYRHHMDKILDLHGRTLAVLCPLMLRGPQTLGEIRNHSQRLFEFDDVEDVELVIKRLMEREPALEPALVCQLPRQPGQKEPRYAHLLSGVPDDAVSVPSRQSSTVDERSERRQKEEPAFESLVQRVLKLEDELERIGARLTDLENASD